jgi:hypothetical protein
VFRKDQFKGSLNLFKSLPDYQPIAHDRSDILDIGQFLVLCYHLPAVNRLQNLTRLFTLN